MLLMQELQLYQIRAWCSWTLYVKNMETHFRKDMSAALGGMFFAEGNHFLTQKDPAGALESYLVAARHLCESVEDADLEAVVTGIKDLLGRPGLTIQPRTRLNYQHTLKALHASKHGHYAAEMEKLVKPS